MVDESVSITWELKKKSKNVLVHDEKLFRQTKCVIRFLPNIEMRENIAKGLHDEVGIGTLTQHTVS